MPGVLFRKYTATLPRVLQGVVAGRGHRSWNWRQLGLALLVAAQPNPIIVIVRGLSVGGDGLDVDAVVMVVSPCCGTPCWDLVFLVAVATPREPALHSLL